MLFAVELIFLLNSLEFKTKNESEAPSLILMKQTERTQKRNLLSELAARDGDFKELAKQKNEETKELMKQRIEDNQEIEKQKYEIENLKNEIKQQKYQGITRQRLVFGSLIIVLLAGVTYFIQQENQQHQVQLQQLQVGFNSLLQSISQLQTTIMDKLNPLPQQGV